MSIKQVWEIIKDYQCSELQMVQNPALAVWNARQSEIDQIKKQLDTVNFFKKGDDSTIENATKVMNEMREQIRKLQRERDQLKVEKAGFKNLVKSLRSEFDLNGGSDQVERQIELLEEAVRGEHE